MVKQTEAQSYDHHESIRDLLPDTKYYYEIGNLDPANKNFDSSYYFITSPLSVHERPVNIWVLGDFGIEDKVARNVKKAYYNYMDNTHTDVWLMLGDIAYYHGKDTEFQKALFDNIYGVLNTHVGFSVILVKPGSCIRNRHESINRKERGTYVEEA